MLFFYGLGALVLVFLGFVIGQKTAPKPAPAPAPAPKTFGLSQVEAVRDALGGLSHDQAAAAKVAAVVVGMEDRVEVDIDAERADLTRRADKRRLEIEHAKASIAQAEASIAAARARDDQLVGVAEAFGF